MAIRGRRTAILHTREHRALVRALRHARDDAGLTQIELAHRLRRPQSFVAKYENAERHLHVIEFLRITDALRIDPCAILRQIK